MLLYYRVLWISTTKFFIAETSFGAYNSNRWTCKLTDEYSLNSQMNLQATGTTHNNDNLAMVLEWY